MQHVARFMFHFLSPIKRIEVACVLPVWMIHQANQLIHFAALKHLISVPNIDTRLKQQIYLTNLMSVCAKCFYYILIFFVQKGLTTLLYLYQRKYINCLHKKSIVAQWGNFTVWTGRFLSQKMKALFGDMHSAESSDGISMCDTRVVYVRESLAF